MTAHAADTVPCLSSGISRPALARHVGRVVTAEARLTRQRRLLQDGTELHCLREVYVFPTITLDHLWIALPAWAQRRLHRERRFSFRAEVSAYVRANGTADYELVFRELVEG